MKLIILTKDQAEIIKGRYGIYSALEPVALPDGMFMLPEHCLNDKDLKDAYKKMNDAVKVNGTKELTELSRATTVKAGEYYIDDISPVLDDPEEATSNLVKCIKDADKIVVSDVTVFLKMTIIKDEKVIDDIITKPLAK